MRNPFMLLLLFVAAFTISAPVLAQPPAEDAKADDAKADDAKADDTKTDAKADETKTEEKADAESDTKEAAETGDGGDDEAKDDGAKAIETDEEAVEAAQGLYAALQAKHWSLALGFGLALLVFVLRKVKVLAKVPAKALPWVTAALGIVGYISAALMTDGVSMMDAVMSGFMAGAAAVGLWEMVLKNFLGKKKESEGGSGG